MQATLHSPLGKVSLGPAPLTIGSAPHNQFVRNDPSVSPRPASSLPNDAGAPAQTPAQTPRRRGLWITLGSVICLLVIGAVIAGALVFLNLPTPSKVLNAYCTDIKAGNYKAAYTQYASVVQKSLSEAAFVAQFTILGKPTGCTVGNVDSKNVATVRSEERRVR